jgi:two-component system LytT family response regulator
VIVFVTAFDHYALPAFDAAALDYVLKPADAEHVARAVRRLLQRGPAPPRSGRPPPDQLVIPDRGRTWVIARTEIDWLEAADNYVVVHAGARAPLLRRTLTALLADLGDAFVRTQRGAAVALAQVASVQALAKGDATVVLKSGAQVPCSRQFRAQLMRRLAAR